MTRQKAALEQHGTCMSKTTMSLTQPLTIYLYAFVGLEVFLSIGTQRCYKVVVDVGITHIRPVLPLNTSVLSQAAVRYCYVRICHCPTLLASLSTYLGSLCPMSCINRRSEIQPLQPCCLIKVNNFGTYLTLKMATTPFTMTT